MPNLIIHLTSANEDTPSQAISGTAVFSEICPIKPVSAPDFFLLGSTQLRKILTTRTQQLLLIKSIINHIFSEGHETSLFSYTLVKELSTTQETPVLHSYLKSCPDF